MGNIITLNPGNGVPYYLVLVVIGAVNLVRWLLYRSKKPWTNKIGGKYVWISLAAVISVVICVVFKINIIRDLANIESIGNLKLTGLLGYVASGVGLSLSSNLGTFIASIPSKMYINDLKAGNPIPGSAEALAPTVIDNPIVSPVSYVDLATPVPLPDTSLVIPPTEYHKFKTKFLTTWISVDKPEFVLLERDDGVNKMIRVTSEDEDIK